MQVIYSCASSLGGVGIASVVEHVATGIYRKGYLKKVIVYGNRQAEIPRKYILNVWFQPTKIFSWLPGKQYYFFKRMYLDLVASRVIGRGCDVFHGWSGECLLSLRAAKRVGAMTLVERPAPHPSHVKSLLDEEYARYGMTGNSRFARTGWIDGLVEDLHRQECQIADYVMAPSEFVYKSFLDHGFPAGRVVLGSRGVDIQRFRPTERSDSVFRVVFVGLLCVRKGIKYLLDAWSQLELRDAELVLAGSVHDEVKPVLAKYLGRKNVRVLGFVRDPVTLYQNSSVCVLPSIVEGSAKVTYEAMACGLPVIVTPNAGAVARDGVDGFLVPIRDVEALRERMCYLYEHPRERSRMGENARKHMENFTWKRYQEDLIGVYEKGLADRQRGMDQ